MENLTKEQIVECLERIQDCSGYMYMSERGVAKFEDKEIDFEGHKMKMKVRKDNGFVELHIDGGKIIFTYTWMIHPRAPKFLDAIDYKLALVNAEKIPDEWNDFANKAGMFVLSFAQRLSAFVWLNRMAPETIAGMAHDLMLITPKKQ